MKRLAIFAFVAFTIFACSDSNSKKGDSSTDSTKKTGVSDNVSFSLNGTLSNVTGEKIYLERTGMGKPIPIDSAIISDNGYFELEGETEIQNFFMLRVDGGTFTTLLIDNNENITLEGNGKDLNLLSSLKGSPGSAKIIDLNQRLSKLNAAIDSMGRVRQEVMKDPSRANEMTKIAQEANKMVTAHKEYIGSFIDQNTGSLACLVALYQSIGRQKLITFDSDPGLFKKVDQELMASLPNSVHTKNFHSMMMKMENEKKQQAIGDKLLDIGAVAPDITLPNPEGKNMSLSSLRGKYVLLDFWAAWCGPCRHESPTLVKAYQKYNSKGFEIFQVSLDKTAKAWKDAIAKDQLTWPYHVSDLKYWQSAPAKTYNVSSIPANFLLDPQGKIIAKQLRGPQLEAKLTEIFR